MVDADTLGGTRDLEGLLFAISAYFTSVYLLGGGYPRTQPLLLQAGLVPDGSRAWSSSPVRFGPTPVSPEPDTEYVACPEFSARYQVPRMFDSTRSLVASTPLRADGPPVWVVREWFSGSREAPSAVERLLLRLNEGAAYPDLEGYACVRPVGKDSPQSVAGVIAALDFDCRGLGACDALIYFETPASWVDDLVPYPGLPADFATIEEAEWDWLYSLGSGMAPTTILPCVDSELYTLLPSPYHLLPSSRTFLDQGVSFSPARVAALCDALSALGPVKPETMSYREFNADKTRHWGLVDVHESCCSLGWDSTTPATPFPLLITGGTGLCW